MAKTSNEHLKKWDISGIADRINEFEVIIVQHGQGESLLQSGRFEKLVKILYSLVSDGIRSLVKKEIVLSAVEYIMALHIDLPSILLDVYNILDTETSGTDLQLAARANLSFFVKHTDKIVTDRLLKERLEIDTLQEMKVLDNKSFQTKFIKVKTKLYYKQKKFNLFREECEGYAKLISELNQRGNNINPSYMMEVIKSLIGCFNLDPNRVLDVILDSFENHVDKSEFYIPLLQAYMPQSKTLSDVLGFKFVHYIESHELTPKSLYIVTVFLLQHSVIFLEDIYGWLQPDDHQITKEWQDKLNDAKKRFKENSAIIVSTKERDEESALNGEEELYKVGNNQKFGLLEALLRIGEWKIFQKICDKLPQTYVMSQYPISYNLCQLIHLLIDPIYRRCCEVKHNLSNISPKTISNSFAPRQVTTFPELKDAVFSMLYTAGSYLRYDPELVFKVIRLLKFALIQAGVTEQGPPPSSENSLYFEILTVLDLTILPSLSAMPCNCCVADEIWDVLKLYPYNYRFALYARWKNETTYKYPIIMYANCDSMKKIKEIMKKITKETTKAAGRQIGKLTHSSPGFIIEYILNQIIMFDNLIMLVVESLKYLTGLSYDFLSYCIIEMLMQPNRANSKQTNGMASSWLVNLSIFCGSVYKKYNIELVGILQYVCNQMKNYKSFDLLILKDIIQKMSGIEFSEDMTNDQLSALSGGEILRSEGGYFTHIRNMRKSSGRLKEALMENNLAISLCLLIGQQRDCIVYKENTNVRLASYLYDQCQDTLVQYGTFLNDVLSIEDYVTRLPSIQSLLTEYHLRADVAFSLSRPKINNAIQAKYDELRKNDANYKKHSEEDKYEKYHNAVIAVTSPVVDAIQPLYPSKIWDNMSPTFMILFWSLTLYDLEVPAQSYQREIAKLRCVNEDLKNSKDLVLVKIKKEQDRNDTLIEKLKDELKKQQDHTQKIMARLKQEKDSWFNPKDVRTGKNEVITQFLQHCLFPRCIFTMVDAMYCAKFIHILHSLKTPNFSTLLCYDRLFCDIIYTVTLCTENEARRYGGFLCAVLDTVMRWHSNRNIFKTECAQYPGFITKFRVSNQFSEPNDHVGYDNYRHVCHKWHVKIAMALSWCLDSKDYIQIRNGLIVLIKILPHFPVMQRLSQMIEKRVDKIIENEKKENRGLTTLAVSYNGLLKAKSSQLIPDHDFHIVTTKESVKSEPHNSKSSVSIMNINTKQTINSIDAVTHQDIIADAQEKHRNLTDKYEIEKIKVIDLVSDDPKNDRDSFELVKNKDTFMDRDKEKTLREEKRDSVEKKSRNNRKVKEDKFFFEDRKDEFRQSTLYKMDDITRSKSGSYRSESSNSWHDYLSPHEDDLQYKVDSFERGEGETKRRKTNNSTILEKPAKLKSSSNSPDSYSSSEKKEKRSKTKRVTRSSSIVIEVDSVPKEKKRVVRKRLRTEEDELLAEKKKRSEDKSTKSHQNGEGTGKAVYTNDYAPTSPNYAKEYDRKLKDKLKSERKKR